MLLVTLSHLAKHSQIFFLLRSKSASEKVLFGGPFHGLDDHKIGLYATQQCAKQSGRATGRVWDWN